MLKYLLSFTVQPDFFLLQNIQLIMSIKIPIQYLDLYLQSILF